MADEIEQATAAPGEKRHVRQPPRIPRYFDQYGNDRTEFCGHSLGMWMSCWVGHACVLPKGHDGEHSESRTFHHEDVIPEGHVFEVEP